MDEIKKIRLDTRDGSRNSLTHTVALSYKKWGEISNVKLDFTLIL